jgi:hypothetical protein
MRSSPARGWWLPEAGIVSGFSGIALVGGEARFSAFAPCKKCLIMLHQTLGAVDARRNVNKE